MVYPMCGLRGGFGVKPELFFVGNEVRPLAGSFFINAFFNLSELRKAMLFDVAFAH